MTDKDIPQLDWGDEIDWWYDLQRDRKLMASEDLLYQRTNDAMDGLSESLNPTREAQAVMPEVTEEARLAGMAGGCAAKNEAMGNALGGRAHCPDCLKDYGSGHHCCNC